MVTDQRLPSLKGWEATRDSLHAYSKVICAVPRALAAPHPYWWHVSLKLEDELLWTDAIEHAALGDRDLRISMDLNAHEIGVEAGGDRVRAFALAGKPPASTLAGWIKEVLADLGIEAELDPGQVRNDEPREYDPQAAGHFLAALKIAHQAQAQVKASLQGETGPIQLWPHNFDQAFEWFSPKMVVQERGEKTTQSPAQINFGFAPGDSSYRDPYFYSNPWPFDPALKSYPLASGARWFENGFSGTLLPYDSLAGQPGVIRALVEYYLSVHRAAAPSLSA
jgi:hypothetical protein